MSTPDKSRLVAAMETATLAAIGHRERADRLEDEADGYVREIVVLSAKLAEAEGRIARMVEEAEGSYRANMAMHAAMVEANRERDELRREVGR